MKRTLLIYALIATTSGCGDPSITIPEPLRMFVTSSAYEASVAADPHVCPGAAGWGGMPERTGYTWIQLIRRAGIHSMSAPATSNITARPDDFWVDLEGNVLFNSLSDMAKKPPLVPLTLAHYGQRVPAGKPVWTGMPSAAHAQQEIQKAPLRGLCTSGLDETHPLQIWSSWSTDNFGYTGMVGAQDLRWLGADSLPCNELAHIYCIEVRKQ
jgi:hypothetical protein